MSSFTVRAVGLVGAMFAAGCIDFTGAPCSTSASCPAGQSCQAGRCSTGSLGTGGSGGGGGGSPGLAKQCEPCQGASDCGPGLSCGGRKCDNARGCFPTDGGSCSQIGGLVCPKVLNFQPYALLEPSQRGCLTDADCSPGSACREKTAAGLGRCLQACQVDGDCYLIDLNLARIQGSCVADSTGDKRCYPSCDSASAAVCGPLGAYCAPFAGGRYGYCEVGCAPCSAQTCGQAGYGCFMRTCDNKLGCYPPDGGVCGLIDLVACP